MPVEPSPKLAAIIVSWNTRELLAGCLASIAAEMERAAATSAGPLTGDLTETFVVDNASSDGSPQMVAERFPWVRLIANGENAGFARANNQALARSRATYALLLNPDTVVHPGALAALVAFMDAHPQAGAAGSLLLNGDGSLQVSCEPMPTPWRDFGHLLFLWPVWPGATYRMSLWSRAAPRPVDVIKGACLLLRRQALDRVGLLDESYFVYTEEVDLCYRLAQGGWSCWWVPAAIVTHHGAASTRQVAETMYVQLYRSKIQFYRKFGDEARVRRYKRYIRLAYWPRLAVSWLGARLRPSLAQRARTYRRLLSELPSM